MDGEKNKDEIIHTEPVHTIAKCSRCKSNKVNWIFTKRGVILKCMNCNFDTHYLQDVNIHRKRESNSIVSSHHDFSCVNCGKVIKFEDSVVFCKSCRKIWSVQEEQIWHIIRHPYPTLYQFLRSYYWLAYSRLFNKKLIHVIGDSHSFVFGRSKLFITHAVGGATAHMLKYKITSTKSNDKLYGILKKLDKKRDVVILVFGEIDCRIHIYNQYRKLKRRYSITELIDRTISNYGEVLLDIKKRGFDFWVLGVPPGATVGNDYNYPFYASPKMHVKINREFNFRLKKFCSKNGIKFIDIYSKVVDKKTGHMLKEYDKDGLHINKNAVKFVIECLATGECR